jgi:hypothetical protein
MVVENTTYEVSTMKKRRTSEEGRFVVVNGESLPLLRLSESALNTHIHTYSV